MLVNTSKIQEQVEELKQSISRSPFSYEEGKAASIKISDMLKGLNENSKKEDLPFGKEEFENLNLAQARYIDEITLGNYQETLSADLMTVETKYVVTDEKQLTSPAGFHPDDKVFVQTKIAIHTNTLKNIPASNVELFVHKMKDLQTV